MHACDTEILMPHDVMSYRSPGMQLVWQLEYTQLFDSSNINSWIISAGWNSRCLFPSLSFYLEILEFLERTGKYQLSTILSIQFGL